MKTQSKLNILLASLVFCLLIAVGLLGKSAWDNHKLEEANTYLNEQVMTSNLEIGKAKTLFGNAQKIIKALERGIQDEIKKNNELVNSYGELKAKYDIVVKSKKTEVVYVPGKTIIVEQALNLDPGLYIATDTNKLTMVTPLEIPFSDHRIDINTTITSAEYKIMQAVKEYHLHMLFEGSLVRTHTKGGAINNYFSLYEVDKQGKKISKLKLQSFQVVTVDQRAPEFYLWAPHLDIGGMLALGKGLKPQYGVTVGISAMGYGITENDLSWRFLNVGVDLGSSLGLGFTPVEYNLGRVIPLISNLWIGPRLGINIDQEWYAGAFLGAQL